ncbi:sensor histidine kinase [Pseudoduganella sp. R-32]|uniref:sensor histidine kinase n=1 Tax=Pseudoduganella sp. R-32 TaxID=3404061 RepID=UPI003CF4BDC5
MRILHLIRNGLILFLLTSPLHSGAATAGFSPINLHHRSWTAKDGSPSSIIGIAQTPDRWMWVASLGGLYRFDGIEFERFTSGGGAGPRSDIWGIRVLENGDLWIGYRFGGASVWRDGRLRTFGAAEGFSGTSVLDFAQDARGRVWASTARGFRVFDGEHWTSGDESESGRTGSCFLAKDSSGTIWARCETGVYALAKGADSFGARIRHLSFGRLALAPDGTLWATGGSANELIPLGGPGKDKPVPDWPRPRGGNGPMLFERDGKHVWSSQPVGVIRHGPTEKGEPFGVANGLSGSLANCFYQDDEGNIWVGTENGLDRFRRTVLSGVALPPAYWDAEAIVPGEDGALWVGGVEVKSPGVRTLGALPTQNSATAVSVVYKDGADVWTGGRDGVWHYAAGIRTRVPLPDYVNVMQFHAIARDTEGGLWVSARGAGVIRLKDGAWQRGGGYRELETYASSISRDRHGKMWFGYPNNGIRMLDKNTVRSYGEEDGLALGATLQILDDGKRAWVGGSDGFNYFDGTRFHRLVGEGDDQFLGVSGIVEYGGSLWLNGAAGITVIANAELERAASNVKHRIRFRRVNHLDGLRGAATNSFPIPTAVAGTDGKLWFSTAAGIFWLDAKRPMTNKMPPGVHVRAINVDGANFKWSKDTVTPIPPNPGRLRIDYTALSFSMPERVRFQYRIEGIDRDWQDGAAVHSATYTGLAPGKYRFRVRAANNDGVRSEADAVADFEVPPAYYQSIWFRTLVVCLLALALLGIYKLRVTYVARRAVEGYAIQAAERTRIARDLHDTLLQSVHVLSLRLAKVLDRLPAESYGRDEIERSLCLVEAALQEGQDKLHGLRRGPASDLLGELSSSFAAEYPLLPLKLSCTGDVKEFQPPVREELRAVAFEALRNAARHSGASQIRFGMEFDNHEFRMSIIDNGKGLPEEVALAGFSNGRWGLVGMRERIDQLGAQLIVESIPGEGTMIKISVTATRAYVG